MAYTLKEALGKLSSTPKSYSFYKHAKLKKPVLFIGALPPPNDVAAALTIAGATEPVAAGKVHWSEEDDTVVFVTGKGGTSFKGTMKALCSGSGVKKVRFNNEPAESTAETNGDNNAPLPPTPTGQTPLQESGNGGSGPLPPTPTNQAPLRTPPPVPPRNPPPQNAPSQNAPTQDSPAQTPPQDDDEEKEEDDDEEKEGEEGEGSSTQPEPPPAAGNQPPTSQAAPQNGTDDHYVPPMPPGGPTLAWLRSLGTPRPPEEVDAEKQFAKDRVTGIAASVSRGRLKNFLSDFKKAVAGAANLQQAQKILRAMPGNPRAKAEALKKYAETVKSLREYYSASIAKEEGDDKRSRKLDFATEVYQAALQAYLNLLGQNAADGTMTSDQERQYHEMRAEYFLLSNPGGVVAADGGSSSVSLLRDRNGRVAYAFKNLSGESTQMRDQGVPVGGGAAQEVLTSKLSDILATICGFQSGFPRTTLATLSLDEGGDPQKNFGALVEGLPGTPFWEENGDGQDYQRLSDEEKSTIEDRCKALGIWDKLGQDEEMGYPELMKAEQAEAIRQIPPKEVQRIILMNLLSANADSKWQSVMFNGDNPRPFDGGGAMLSEDMMMTIARDKVDNFHFANTVSPSFGMQMLAIPNTMPVDDTLPGEPHPAASTPLDTEFVGQIRDLDVEQVRAAMIEELEKIQNADPSMKKAVSYSNIDNMTQSMTFMKEIVTENPGITTFDFVIEYNLRMKGYLQAVLDRKLQTEASGSART